MDDLARELIDTLVKARNGVRIGLSQCRAEPAPDAVFLEQLLIAVLTFATRADGLCLMIAERGLADSLIEVAEELSDFFQDAKEEIEAMLEPALK